MAQTESKIKLIFDGAERGVVAAAAKSKAAIKSLDDQNSRLSKSSAVAEKGLLGVGKAMLGLSAAGSAVNVVGGVVGALTQLAPAALLLPGALLSGAAAMGTFKIATAGMGDALKAGLSGDMEKFAEATKDMAPAMQSAAKAVVSFKPQVDQLKRTVQGNFWADFAEGIRSAGETYLPILEKGLGGIASQMGTVGLQSLRATQTPFFTGAVTSILSSTESLFRELSEAGGNFLTGLVGIGKVGAQYLPRLGESVGGLTKRFAEWVQANSEAGGSIERMIDGALQGFKDLGGIVKNVGSIVGSVFRGLGADFSSPLASIRELTGEVAAFLKTAEAQEGLRALGETLRVVGEQVGRVLMTALRELAPTLVKLAPVAQEVARTLGDLLVSAIETLGPLIRGIADAFNAFPGSASAATVAVVGFVAAIKTIKAVNAVTDLLGIESMFSRIGKSAGGAEKAAGEAGKRAGISWGKGFVGTLGLVGAGVAGTLTADALIPKDIGSWGSQAARDMLGEMAAVFRGEGQSTFQALNIAQWISNPIAMGVEVGRRELMKLFGFEPPPLKVTADAAPAYETVGGWTRAAEGTVGMARLNADGSGANTTVSVWQSLGNRAMATGRLLADSSAANAVVSAWQGLGNRTAATARLLANSAAGNAVISAWRSLGDRTTATARLLANTSAATGALQAWRNTWSNFTVTVRAVLQRIGFADGGPVLKIPGFAGGGPIRGAGTSRSDSIPAMLSNGEHVLTAQDVRNAGGHGAILAMRAALARGDSGPSPMAASAAAAMRTPAAPSSSGGPVELRVVGSGGGDDLILSWLMKMQRAGRLQLVAA